MPKKVIINLTPTGMIPTKSMTPHVPITPKEIIAEVLRCAKLGVSVVHLHARDKEGNPTYKKDVYKEIILGIREKRSDLVLGVSCSGRDFNEFEKRSQVLELTGDSKPDMASLTLSSLNFNKTASVNAPDMILQLAEKMNENNIKQELEIFDVGMVNYAHYLIRKNVLQPQYYCNIILGNIACAQAKPLHYGLIQEELPSPNIVTVGGVGDFQSEANMLGLIFGDGVRIGLEDNIYYDKERTQLATNKSMVNRIKNQIINLGYDIATPSDARQMLQIG
jgi:3-keto-5-aminohexanoate cleavage enzyme